MRRKGQLTDEQAEDHPQRSIITRALGPEPEVEVDVQTVPASPGDVFLICSDGLTTMISDEQIARLLAGATSMDAAVRALVDEANRAGGRDNVTALAFRLEDAAAPRRAPEGATLIGPSAEAEGLTATEVRRRAAAAAAKERREALAAKPNRRRLRTTAKVARRAPRRAAALAFGAWYGNRHVWFLGTDDRRPGRDLPRPSLRTSLRGDALRRALREPDPDRLAVEPAGRDAVTGHDLRSHSDAVDPGRRNRKERGHRRPAKEQKEPKPPEEKNDRRTRPANRAAPANGQKAKANQGASP